MSNQMDARFQKAGKYVLSNSELRAECATMGGTGKWQTIVTYKSGQSDRMTFASEGDMREKLEGLTRYRLEREQESVPASGADRREWAATPRMRNPRAEAEQTAMPYTQDQINMLHDSVLKAFVTNHPGAFLLDVKGYNWAIFNRAVKDTLNRDQSVALVDENLQAIVDWLHSNNFLWNGKTNVNRYRRSEEIIEMNAKREAAETAAEVARRNALPLSELQRLIVEETGRGSVADPRLTGTRAVNARTEVVDQDIELRRTPFEELRAAERARQIEANRRQVEAQRKRGMK